MSLSCLLLLLTSWTNGAPEQFTTAAEEMQEMGGRHVFLAEPPRSTPHDECVLGAPCARSTPKEGGSTDCPNDGEVTRHQRHAQESFEHGRYSLPPPPPWPSSMPAPGGGEEAPAKTVRPRKMAKTPTKPLRKTGAPRANTVRVYPLPPALVGHSPSSAVAGGQPHTSLSCACCGAARASRDD